MAIVHLSATSPAMKRSRSRGVTLIELMVGMAIGLISTIIITQVFALAEGQKRTTTAGSDAQVNGALSLYTLERNVQMAGFGLTTTRDAFGCPIRAQRGGTNVTWTLAPVVINDGASGASDSITTMMGVNLNPPLPTRVSEAHPADGTEFLVGSPVGFNVGDAVVAVPESIDAANWCTLFSVTALVSDASGHHVAHTVNSTTGIWNQDPAASILPATGYPAASYLINAGRLVSRRYFVDTTTNSLQEAVTDTQVGVAEAAARDLYPQVVNLQALYGKDTNADGIVDTYDNVTPTTQLGWVQVRTIRIAVVARSTQYERDEVTTSQPLWDVGNAGTVAGAVPCGDSRCITLTINGVPDWQHYRYKVYDTVVPLRNVLWSS
jgi:type IV pilus assembly protein PilW